MRQMLQRIRPPSELEHLVVYSDGNDDYEFTLPKFFDVTHVDYGQLVKVRVGGKVVDKYRKVVFGEPFILRVHTNNVENFNGILRERVSCLVRRTKCIAKRKDFLEKRLFVFQFYWNFMHVIHGTQTPAMLEGVSTNQWSWSRFLHYKIKLY